MTKDDGFWDDIDFWEGVAARRQGFYLWHIPHNFETPSYRAWRAGWCDEDMAELIEETETTEEEIN